MLKQAHKQENIIQIEEVGQVLQIELDLKFMLLATCYILLATYYLLGSLQVLSKKVFPNSAPPPPPP